MLLVSYIPPYCGNWNFSGILANGLSQVTIAGAYLAIASAIAYFLIKDQNIQYRWMLWLFSGFFISAGIGHLLEIWAIQHPIAEISTVTNIVTAVIAPIAAVMLIKILPEALKLPNLEQQKANIKILEAALVKLQKTKTELQQAQQHLVLSEKMSALGQMMASIAHEINNPINFINGNIQYFRQYVLDTFQLVALYEQHCPPIAEIQDFQNQIEWDFLKEDWLDTLSSTQKGVDCIIALVQSLRNFSRVDETVSKAVDIHEGIDSTLVILSSKIKSKSGNRPTIAVKKHYGELPLIDCYPSQLNQVFMNILANAADAFDSCVLTEPAIFIDTWLERDRAWISIKDNGSGIPEDAQKHIFEPFFTTKPVGKGTGLGLAISQQIVEKHKGDIHCVSGVGKGTEFIIGIPIKQSFA
jgi:signal transduction histidine kinase